MLRIILAVGVAFAACGACTPRDAEGCVVDGLDASATRAMMASCAVARARFTDLTGLPAWTLRLSFGPSLAARSAFEPATIVQQLPTPTAFAAAASRLGLRGDWTQETSTIARHESGHSLLAAALLDTAASTGKGRYGTRLPDWFDEAVAEWLEPDDARAARLRQAPDDARAVRSLREFVSEPHPFLGRESVFERSQVTTYGACRGDCGATYRAGTRTISSKLMRDGAIHVDTAWSAPGSEPAARAGEAYYPVALSLITFVHERFGADGVRRLTKRLVEGASSVNALGELEKAGGFDAFEREWRSWLARRP